MKHIYTIEYRKAAAGEIWQPWIEPDFNETYRPTFSNIRDGMQHIRLLYEYDSVVFKDPPRHYRLVNEIGTVINDIRY